MFSQNRPNVSVQKEYVYHYFKIPLLFSLKLFHSTLCHSVREGVLNLCMNEHCSLYSIGAAGASFVALMFLHMLDL